MGDKDEDELINIRYNDDIVDVPETQTTKKNNKRKKNNNNNNSSNNKKTTIVKIKKSKKTATTTTMTVEILLQEQLQKKHENLERQLKSQSHLQNLCCTTFQHLRNAWHIVNRLM